jgi:lipopolysaccharide export system permease protein
LFGFSVIVFLFLLQFLIKNIDKLVGKGLDIWIIIQLIALNTAWMIVLAVPIGTLFSTLMAFGSMASVHEITVIKSSGRSLIRMMMPVLMIGMILSLWLFWFNDEVLPEANHRAKILLGDITRKKPTFTLESGKFSNDFEGYTIFARKVDSISGMLLGVTIYDHRRMNEYNIASADSGISEFSLDLSKLILTLYNGEVHQFKPEDISNYRIVNFKNYRILIDAQGFAFQRSSEEFMSRGDREMRIQDMRAITQNSISRAIQIKKKIATEFKRQFEKVSKVNLSNSNSGFLRINFRDNGEIMSETDSIKLRIKGLKEFQKHITYLKTTLQSEITLFDDYSATARQYEVEIQKKYAIPFACIVFILVGCPLGIFTRRGNFGFSAAITLGFYLLYWACLIGGEKLSDRGFLSPVLSMWSANIIIGTAGILLMLKVNNESFTMPWEKFIKNLKI